MVTARPSAIVDQLLATVDYLRIAIDDRAGRWLRCADLLGDPAALAAVVAPTKTERGTDRDDVAMSLFVQGYAFRIATVAIGSWLLADAVLDVAPPGVAIALGRGRPNAVNLLTPTVTDEATVADVHATLVNGHLAPLVEVAHQSCRVGAALLWGNVAASCASSFGAFASELPARRIEIRDRAEQFFAAARPELRHAGRLVSVGTRFAWERRSCCLWYRTESAWMCEDCSLRPESDRQELGRARRRPPRLVPDAAGERTPAVAVGDRARAVPRRPSPHGGDAHRLAAWLGRRVEEILDLSVSLNPVPPDLGDVVASSAEGLRRYPDAEVATRVLAEAIGVDEELLVLTNGGAEAIALVAQLEPTGDVVDPEFSLYRRHLRLIAPGAPRWRSNPSNPLGRLADAGALAAVWDEAFYPLATGHWTRGDDDAWRVGSLTKLWACPGLRIGYAIAPDAAAAARLRDIQPRWSVGTLALAAVEQLAPATDLAAASTRVHQLRASLVDGLVARGLDVRDTAANWVLVHHDGLRQQLAPRGILVRDCTNFGLAGVARIGVPTDDDRARLFEALDVGPDRDAGP